MKEGRVKSLHPPSPSSQEKSKREKATGTGDPKTSLWMMRFQIGKEKSKSDALGVSGLDSITGTK